jgi:hypothetical protein
MFENLVRMYWLDASSVRPAQRACRCKFNLKVSVIYSDLRCARSSGFRCLWGFVTSSFCWDIVLVAQKGPGSIAGLGGQLDRQLHALPGDRHRREYARVRSFIFWRPSWSVQLKIERKVVCLYKICWNVRLEALLWARLILCQVRLLTQGLYDWR